MRENNKKKLLILSIICMLSLVIITTAVSYAIFQYVKLGATENIITTGSITFLYTEVNEVGTGIQITDGLPITDSQGKVQTGDGNVFHFKITSETTGNAIIPYEVTARKKDGSTLDDDVVKLYLTEVNGGKEQELSLSKFSDLKQTDVEVPDNIVEKTIYKGKVSSSMNYYEKAFRLRMWIDNDTDFSNNKYNDKTFTVTVNVYANAKIITEDEVLFENNTEVDSIYIGNSRLLEVTGKDYDYEIILPEGTLTAGLTVSTKNSNATVTFEKIDSLAFNQSKKSSVKRLATRQDIELLPGDNYFLMKVISANTKETSEHKILIIVKESAL